MTSQKQLLHCKGLEATTTDPNLTDEQINAYDQQFLAAAEAVGILYRHRDQIPGVEVDYGQDRPMRHFISRFRFASA